MNECLFIYARPVSPLRIHTRYSPAFAPIPAGRFGCSLAGKVGPVLNIFPPFMAGRSSVSLLLDQTLYTDLRQAFGGSFYVRKGFEASVMHQIDRDGFELLTGF